MPWVLSPGVFLGPSLCFFRITCDNLWKAHQVPCSSQRLKIRIYMFLCSWSKLLNKIVNKSSLGKISNLELQNIVYFRIIAMTNILCTGAISSLVYLLKRYKSNPYLHWQPRIQGKICLTILYDIIILYSCIWS